MRLRRIGNHILEYISKNPLAIIGLQEPHKLLLIPQHMLEYLIGNNRRMLHNLQVEYIGHRSNHNKNSLEDIALGLLYHGRRGCIDDLVQAVQGGVFEG